MKVFYHYFQSHYCVNLVERLEDRSLKMSLTLEYEKDFAAAMKEFVNTDGTPSCSPACGVVFSLTQWGSLIRTVAESSLHSRRLGMCFIFWLCLCSDHWAAQLSALESRAIEVTSSAAKTEYKAKLQSMRLQVRAAREKLESKLLLERTPAAPAPRRTVCCSFSFPSFLTLFLFLVSLSLLPCILFSSAKKPQVLGSTNLRSLSLPNTFKHIQMLFLLTSSYSRRVLLSCSFV